MPSTDCVVVEKNTQRDNFLKNDNPRRRIKKKSEHFLVKREASTDISACGLLKAYDDINFFSVFLPLNGT